MSSVLHLISDSALRQPTNDPATEKVALLPISHLSQDHLQLRTLVQSLQKEIARLEHELMMQKVLLNNSKVREYELRAELALGLH